MSPHYITEERFDNLSPESQRDYRYCDICGMYYKYQATTICPCQFPS